MNRQNGGTAGRVTERLGWVLLLLVLAAFMWVLGVTVNRFEEFLDRSASEAALPGIELTVVPLAALAAARLRFGVDRILALRASRVGPWLPLLMAASLFGLAAYLAWTWEFFVRPVYGVELEFGPLRWLGIALAAGFTWVWMPLFPRITATLAGMIAGPALFALIGYSFFPECMRVAARITEYEFGDLILSSIATCVWTIGALPLGLLSSPREEKRPAASQMYFALWSGVVMLAMVLSRTLSYSAC